MKRNLIKLLSAIFVVVLLCGQMASAGTLTRIIYTDPTTKVTLKTPDGWVEAELSGEQDTVKKKYVPAEENGSCIIYSWVDLWNSLSETERRYYTKEQLAEELMTPAVIAESYDVNENDVRKVVYNDQTYYEVVFGGDTLSITTLITVHDGYGYTFQFCSFGNSDDSVFETFMRSVQYPAVVSSDSTDTSAGSADTALSSALADLVVSLIITIVIYSLPIIIYRYAVRKKPVEPKKAKKITIIYAICAFLVMSALLMALGEGAAGSAIILWSWVNYKVLKSGYQPEPEPTGETERPCPYCGQPILSSDSVCKHCATALVGSPADASTAQAQEAAQAVSVKPVCSCCRRELPPDAAFCPYCGHQVKE